MKKILFTLVAMIFAISPIYGEKLKVVAAYPYIASIVQEVSGNLVNVQTLASGKSDPHFIVPRPSYIAKLRNADLLILNGGQLEIGWMPPLVSQANNAKLNGDGTLDLSFYVSLQDIPRSINRIHGDVHPSGNPHFILDPDNVILVAQAISNRLSKLDTANAARYQKELGVFIKKWKEHLSVWDQSMKSLNGVSVVQYHDLYHYLLSRYRIKSAGTIERLPGIPPTAEHLVKLEKVISENSVKLIVQDVYHPDDAARILAEKSRVRVVILPHDVGATAHAENIFALFDEIVRLMTHD